MPLPRYQPLKKFKPSGPSISDLDDACLSKILGYVLEFSSLRDSAGQYSTVGDNGTAEKNLSLVSKRWYFLTQTQIADRGVHKVNLDTLKQSSKVRKNCIPTIRANRIAGGVLSHRNQNSIKTTNTISSNDKIQSASDFYSIDTFRRIQPRLYKYKHILFEGTLPTDEFKKLIVALNAARTERLSLNVTVEKCLGLLKDRISLPVELRHLERLTLHWNLDKRSSYSNELTWRIYKRATNLRVFELHARATSGNIVDEKQPFGQTSEPDPIISPLNHHSLERVIFTWTPNDLGTDCPILPLIKSILHSESSVTEVETNDPAFIEYLIKSADRVCTTHRLKNLKLSSPLRDISLLTKLLQSSTLGTERLSIETDDFELLNDVRLAMEYFKPSRPPNASCRLVFSFRDQKFADSEDKIKTMVHLSRMADLVFSIESQQRISIDCCHLMWSVGRALTQTKQPTDISGSCLFKITIVGINPSKLTEVTVPFGLCRNYSVNSTREDLNRHREIMKSLKKDCYHQFVRSVRGNLTP